MRVNRWVVLPVLACAVAGFVGLGGWEFLSDGDRVEEFFTERGALGPIVFVLIMWAVQPTGVPGAVFMVPAALVWPLPVAMALSWVGNMGASTIAFYMARYLFRDWAQSHLPPRVRVWDERLRVGGVREVTMLRVVTGQFTPADWLLGVSAVRLRPFILGTGLGIIPGIVLITTIGGGLVELMSNRAVRLPVLIAIGVALLARRVVRFSRARAQSSEGVARP